MIAAPMPSVERWRSLVATYAPAAMVPYVLGIIQVESGGNPDVRGAAGEIGLMQVLEGTAADMGIGPEALRTPAGNIRAGIAYLSYLAGRYAGNLERMIAAYNAGPGHVPEVGAVPNPGYVSRVLSAAAAYGSAGAAAAIALWPVLALIGVVAVILVLS